MFYMAYKLSKSEVEQYVTDNYDKLLVMFNVEEDSVGYDQLVEYFYRFPDSMPGISYDSPKFVDRFSDHLITLNNIGGVYRYVV